MRRLSVGLMIGLIFINSLLPFSWASDNPMFDFYNGLTEVIERSMNNPEACVIQAENYIKNNIGILQKAAETGRRMAQQNTQKYENMNQEELESAMEEAEKAMSDPKIAESMNISMIAINKFTEAINEFTMKHPDEGERIMGILSEYSPQNEMY
jgi:hypothetical protein